MNQQIWLTLESVISYIYDQIIVASASTNIKSDLFNKSCLIYT